jgi:SAM-dependent methyltransferase
MAEGTGTLDGVTLDWRPSPQPRRDARTIAVRPPLLERLHRLLGASRPPRATHAAQALAAASDPLAIRQRLYGQGYTVPGDAAWVLSLVEPFRLGAGSSLLDLAAGLGGPARVVAQALHQRVMGLERDAACVRQANALSAALGARHLVEVQLCDPESLELPIARFDGALGREASYAVAEKERYLRVVTRALRGRGAIVLTDFVLNRAAGDRDEVSAWSTALPRPASLWTEAQYADCFRSLGFTLRAAEDISSLYRRQIVAAWVRYLRAGEIRGLPMPQAEAVLAEAEAGRRAVAALESGALRYYRFEALRQSALR